MLLLASFVVAGAHAAVEVEVNKASQAELEALAGVGPDLAERILAQRRQRAFDDWLDLIGRVRGVGRASAGRLSAQGLRVNGEPLPAAAQRAR
jgi:competence protein ComEA